MLEEEDGAIKVSENDGTLIRRTRFQTFKERKET